MASYDYKCKACGLDTVIQHSMAQDPIDTCPECGSKEFKIVINSSAGGFRIGGKGVYKPTSCPLE